MDDERIEMHVDLKAKALFKSKNLSEYWSNINTATMYPKIRAAVEPFLLAFPTSYMAEASFSNVNATLPEQRNRLNMPNCSQLPLRLAKLQPNVNNLPAANQTHLPH